MGPDVYFLSTFNIILGTTFFIELKAKDVKRYGEYAPYTHDGNIVEQRACPQKISEANMSRLSQIIGQHSSCETEDKSD